MAVYNVTVPITVHCVQCSCLLKYYLVGQNWRVGSSCWYLHYTDTDILARILADTSDTREFLKLGLFCGKLNGEVARYADILDRIVARMSVSVSWNAAFTQPNNQCR